MLSRLVSFAKDLTPARIPPEVVHNLKLRVLDTLGICFATHTLPYARAVMDLVRNVAAPGDCTVVGLPEGIAAPGAALANGALAHGAELDDCHAASITHTASALLPAVLAVGEERDASGEDCLAAAAVGYELLPRLALAAPMGFHDRGLQTTSMCAPLVNALLASKLMGLGAAQMTHAAGLAGALAGGLRTGNDDGSWTKRLFSGWTAQTGILAAGLAARGFTGPAEILEGRFGLYRAHLGEDSWNPGALRAGLGEVWETLRASFRLFPCSHGLHSTIECCLRLRAEHRVDPSRVAKVECRLPEPMYRWWFQPEEEKRRPPTSYAAMFSIPYVVGVALVRGEVDLSSFEEPVRRDPAVLAVADKTHWAPDRETPFPKTFPGWVILHMADGTRYEARQLHEPGSLENPISEEELFGKFDRNTQSHLSPAAADFLRERILGLEKVLSVREVLRACRPA